MMYRLGRGELRVFGGRISFSYVFWPCCFVVLLSKNANRFEEVQKDHENLSVLHQIDAKHHISYKW